MTIHRNVPDAPRISLFLTRKTLALPSLQALPFGITIAFWPLEVFKLERPGPGYPALPEPLLVPRSAATFKKSPMLA